MLFEIVSIRLSGELGRTTGSTITGATGNGCGIYIPHQGRLGGHNGIITDGGFIIPVRYLGVVIII